MPQVTQPASVRVGLWIQVRLTPWAKLPPTVLCHACGGGSAGNGEQAAWLMPPGMCAVLRYCGAVRIKL